MFQVQPPEVFTVDEVARAAGAPREHLRALVDSGAVRLIPGTPFVAADEAVRIGRELRRHPPAVPVAPAEIFAHATGSLEARRPGAPVLASSLVHAVLFGAVVLISTMNLGTTSTDVRADEHARMVFVVSPGPGGGGGGGGLRSPLPAPKIERKAATPRRAVTVPAVTPHPVVTTTRNDVEPPKRPTPAAAPAAVPTPPRREPDPLPSSVLVAPVVATAADARDREGVIEKGRGDAESQGSGAGGGAGSGQGTGSGEGLGSGIGAGSGGGTGGGPYRPGSGVEPPRLVREIKADYTEDARRRSLSGEVLLEIIVRSDGTVGDVRLLRGLGAGLDQRAVDAVRQWQFEPARRRGTPVDVVVEVAVEFTLR